MLLKWIVLKDARKMKKEQMLMDRIMNDVKIMKEILDSPNFKQINDVFAIEETYKFPKDECITTSTYETRMSKKMAYPILKEDVTVEELLYRHNIYMNEYFRPSIEKEKTSTPKEIKKLRSKKRFKKWYAENKERILNMVEGEAR